MESRKCKALLLVLLEEFDKHKEFCKREHGFAKSLIKKGVADLQIARCEICKKVVYQDFAGSPSEEDTEDTENTEDREKEFHFSSFCYNCDVNVICTNCIVKHNVLIQECADCEEKYYNCQDCGPIRLEKHSSDSDSNSNDPIKLCHECTEYY